MRMQAIRVYLREVIAAQLQVNLPVLPAIQVNCM